MRTVIIIIFWKKKRRAHFKEILRRVKTRDPILLNVLFTYDKYVYVFRKVRLLII